MKRVERARRPYIQVGYALIDLHALGLVRPKYGFFQIVWSSGNFPLQVPLQFLCKAGLFPLQIPLQKQSTVSV
jgi:hypothetical protein